MASGSGGTTKYLEYSGLENYLEKSDDMKSEIEELELPVDPEGGIS